MLMILIFQLTLPLYDSSPTTRLALHLLYRKREYLTLPYDLGDAGKQKWNEKLPT